MERLWKSYKNVFVKWMDENETKDANNEESCANLAKNVAKIFRIPGNWLDKYLLHSVLYCLREIVQIYLIPKK